MKKRNLLIFALSFLLVACLIYGILRVMMIRQRKVNMDASMKYANVLSLDISNVCYLVEVTDEGYATYEDATYVNCYFSSDKNDNNKAKLAINSDGELFKVTYYSLVDTSKPKAVNVDNMNKMISKVSGALLSTKVKLKYGDFVNLNKLPASMTTKIDSSNYKKEFKILSSGNEENELSLRYVVNGKLGFNYYVYEIK